jgi:hypothetical protein
MSIKGAQQRQIHTCSDASARTGSYLATAEMEGNLRSQQPFHQRS